MEAVMDVYIIYHRVVINAYILNNNIKKIHIYV